MADSSNLEAGRQFASDLRLIREDRGITVEALHEQTKIPTNLLEGFEQNGLFDHPMFNRVYLRSFVRTYAEVVGIPTDPAMAALDEAIDGRYAGELARQFIVVPESPVEEQGSPAETLEAVSEASSDPEVAAVPAPDFVPEEAPEDHVRDPWAEPPAVPPVVEESPASTVPEEPPPAETESAGTVLPDYEPPPEREVEPVEREPAPATVYTPPAEAVPAVPPTVAPVPAAPVLSHTGDQPPIRPARREPMPTERPNRWRVLGPLIGLIALVGLALVAYRFVGGTDADDAQAVDRDTSRALTSVPAAPVDSAALPVTLGDTMVVTIIAATAPVQDIKVTVDDDLRRPYWIELGESRAFTATDRIIIERQLEKIQLQLQGRPYPTDRLDEQGRIVITRPTAEQFLAGAR